MNEPAPSVVLSYGLGADSTALLLRWLHDPASRDFDLSELMVITAMVGDEYAATGQLVTEHVLPLLRAHQVRYVQVARRTASQSDGVLVLSDTRDPRVLALAGAYKLSDELRQAGTVPQSGGARLCSAKAKGWPLDHFIVAATGGRPFRHVVGFEAGEQGRARRDAGYDTPQRTGTYPLIDWDWDRRACLDYIAAHTGVSEWEKSCCVMCPFALGSKAGRLRTLQRYDRVPDAGVQALMMEHLAVCLNPTQGLIAGDRLADLCAAHGRHDLLARFHARLHATPHCVYEVRRVLRARNEDPTRMANASRELRVLQTGSRTAMLAALHREAVRLGETVDEHDTVGRVWLRRRAPVFPCGEHYLVAGPAGALPKAHRNFPAWWAALPPVETLTVRAA